MSFLNGCDNGTGIITNATRISEVSITLDKGSGIGGVSLTVGYDKNQVSYHESIPDRLLLMGSAKGATILANDTGSEIKIGLLHETGLHAGKIARVAFKIEGLAVPDQKAYQVTSLEAVDLMGNPIPGVSSSLTVMNR
jgi:hypothetical protein